METAANPIQIAKEWIEENSDSSQKIHGVQMVVSTLGKRGYPASRVLRLRDINDKGFVFFTLYNSNKSSELEKNPKTSAVIYFPKQYKMIRIQGEAEKTSDKENDLYFDNFPDEYKGYFSDAKKPGQPIDFEKYVEEMIQEKKQKKEKLVYKRPPEAGAWRIIPNYILFYEPFEAPEAQGVRKLVEYTLNKEGVWNSTFVSP